MSPARILHSETSLNLYNRTQSSSNVSRISPAHSAYSGDSDEYEHDFVHSSSHTSSHHHKSGSFSRLFRTKEPSLDSFKQLAELQQRELAQQGRTVPFGVSSTKLPSAAKDDYKKAKQRAKERAKLHEVMKEKMKLHDQDERQRYSRRSSFDSTATSEERWLTVPSSTTLPGSPRSICSKFSALDPLPEMPYTSPAASLRSNAFPPSSRGMYNHDRTSSAHATGVLRGEARKEALPWE